MKLRNSLLVFMLLCLYGVAMVHGVVHVHEHGLDYDAMEIVQQTESKGCCCAQEGGCKCHERGFCCCNMKKDHHPDHGECHAILLYEAPKRSVSEPQLVGEEHSKINFSWLALAVVPLEEIVLTKNHYFARWLVPLGSNQYIQTAAQLRAPPASV